jgi:RNA polymerase sigma-70 factor (ECF subfamily)
MLSRVREVAMADPEAIQQLHHAHAAALWGYVLRLTGDRALAEDVVQETLLRAWRHDVTDGPQGSARAWLFTVARNLVVDDARSARHRHEAPTDDLPERPDADRIDRLFDSLVVTDALRSIGEDHRAVVVKAYFGRLTTAEIAAELDIPPGTVKSRLHYGLRALRLALQERGVTR